MLECNTAYMTFVAFSGSKRELYEILSYDEYPQVMSRESVSVRAEDYMFENDKIRRCGVRKK